MKVLVLAGRPSSGSGDSLEICPGGQDLWVEPSLGGRVEDVEDDVDLLSGKCVHGVSSGGRTNIAIDAETLIGVSTDPADLSGFGPVIAEIGKKTVFESLDGEWRVTVTDNGAPVATGTLARRPSESQRRQIVAEHPKCVMVGCRETTCVRRRCPSREIRFIIPTGFGLAFPYPRPRTPIWN